MRIRVSFPDVVQLYQSIPPWYESHSDFFGGDLASTRVVKHKEHFGAHEDLVKNVHTIVANNDYAMAA